MLCKMMQLQGGMVKEVATDGMFASKHFNLESGQFMQYDPRTKKCLSKKISSHCLESLRTTM